MSRRWKEIKEDPARLSKYNDRARQTQNEAEELGDDSQNEQTMVDRPAVKQLKKAPKTQFVDTDSDDSDDEQGPTTKQPQKASKASEFVNKGMDDEQGQQPKKAPKAPGYSGDEQGPTVKCIMMHSTEDGQEPSVKKLQKTSKILKFVDTGPGAEDEQGPTVKKPQKASKIPGGSDDESSQKTPLWEPTKKPPAIGRTPAVSSTHILTSGVRKGKQCRVRASDETGKFCIYHKGQT